MNTLKIRIALLAATSLLISGCAVLDTIYDISEVFDSSETRTGMLTLSDGTKIEFVEDAK